MRFVAFLASILRYLNFVIDMCSTTTNNILLKYINSKFESDNYLFMEFISTNRGALVYEGYKYQINRRGLDGRIFWRCSKSRICSGTLTTLNGEIISNRADQPCTKYLSKEYD